MRGDNPSYRPVVAAIAAGVLVLAFGLTYHTLAARLAAPVSIVPMAPEALAQLPMQIGDWIGEDVPMDEAIVRATGTDAHINRRYSRKNGLESISLFVGCSVSIFDRAIHRPEICYMRAGWTLLDRDTVELTLSDGARLPCSVFQFQRGDLQIERATVLHYYIVDGQCSDDISLLQSKLWRLGGTADYLARVLIVAPNESATADSAVRLVSSFAVDSAASIAQLLDDLQKSRAPSESSKPHDGK